MLMLPDGSSCSEEEILLYERDEHTVAHHSPQNVAPIVLERELVTQPNTGCEPNFIGCNIWRPDMDSYPDFYANNFSVNEDVSYDPLARGIMTNISDIFSAVDFTNIDHAKCCLYGFNNNSSNNKNTRCPSTVESPHSDAAISTADVSTTRTSPMLRTDQLCSPNCAKLFNPTTNINNNEMILMGNRQQLHLIRIPEGYTMYIQPGLDLVYAVKNTDLAASSQQFLDA